MRVMCSVTFREISAHGVIHKIHSPSAIFEKGRICHKACFVTFIDLKHIIILLKGCR